MLNCFICTKFKLNGSAFNFPIWIEHFSDESANTGEWARNSAIYRCQRHVYEMWKVCDPISVNATTFRNKSFLTVENKLSENVTRHSYVMGGNRTSCITSPDTSTPTMYFIVRKRRIVFHGECSVWFDFIPFYTATKSKHIKCNHLQVIVMRQFSAYFWRVLLPIIEQKWG